MSYLQLCFCLAACVSLALLPEPSFSKPGPLRVHETGRYLAEASAEPFLWLGCTPWGMTEWLTREAVDHYLDDRKSKGMNVVQLCLFWGKRTDEPLNFTDNPRNAYRHRALRETDGAPDPRKPTVEPGGSPLEPNDYWDHVEYCLEAIERRGMHAAVLPIWGRRYVNATHEGQSARIFDASDIFECGRFLGERFRRWSGWGGGRLGQSRRARREPRADHVSS